LRDWVKPTGGLDRIWVTDVHFRVIRCINGNKRKGLRDSENRSSDGREIQRV